MYEQITIEKLNYEDIGAVADLITSLVPWEVTPEAAEAVFHAQLRNADYAFFVAKQGGNIVGTATAICCHALAANFLAIEDVIVAPERTGHGIGTLLMKAVDDFARERNCQYAILVSSGHRVNAHRFYEKCGFAGDVRGFRKGYN